MGASSNSKKFIESETMSAPKPVINLSLPESAEIKLPESKKESKIKDNIIKMKVKIERNDVDKATKILFNMREKIEGCDIKELNESNAELYINGKKSRYKTYFIPEKTGIYDIKIKINNFIKSCCRLFYSIDNVQSIDLSQFNAEKVTNISNMIYECNSLESIDLSSFKAPKVAKISNMISNCINLTHTTHISYILGIK